MEGRKSLASGLRIAAIIISGALPVLLFAYAEGPDPGHAGVPGESDCTQCHFGGSGSGKVTITFPSGNTFTPGVAQTLTVTVSDPSLRRWGFQLTARSSSDATQQAGTFTPGSDGMTQLSCGTPPFQYGYFSNEIIGNQCSGALAQYPAEYIEHTFAGTQTGRSGSASYTFTWNPPANATGGVTFYIAGNAANGDGGTGGDHIYLASYTLSPTATNAPLISGIVNAAGYQQTVASGAWAAITGSNLSATTRTWNASDFNGQQEPASLDGVSVTMGGQPASLSYISPRQINVQVPNLAPGPADVLVTNANGSSTTFSVNVANESPAFFLWNGRYAVATRPDYSYVGPAGLFTGITTTPAKPGDTVILWGTGFGPTSPPIASGTLTPSTSASVTDSISVKVGGWAANVLGGALTPGTAGLYQIVIQIPTTVPNGDLPIIANANGIPSPSNVFVTVHN